MKRKIATLTLAAAGIVSAPALAEVIDGMGPLTCGIFEVHECLPDYDCLQVRPEEVNIRTRFLSVDPEKREIRATGTERKTVAESVLEVGDKLVFVGAEAGELAEQAGVGYSLTIARTSGAMAMAITGDGVSFVAFGACTALERSR